MQHDDNTLTFLRQKIENIRIALFKAEIDSELQLPNNIISTLKVDDEGYIWFYTSCNGKYALQVDKEFFAYLDYYQKGRDARLRISGRARVVEGCGSDAATVDDSNLLLLKLKMMQAEYFGMDTEQHQTWVHKIKTTFTELLSATPIGKRYRFS